MEKNKEICKFEENIVLICTESERIHCEIETKNQEIKKL